MTQNSTSQRAQAARQVGQDAGDERVSASSSPITAGNRISAASSACSVPRYRSSAYASRSGAAGGAPARRCCRGRGRLDDEQVPAARGGLRNQPLEHLAIVERGNGRVDLRVLGVEEVGSALRGIRAGQRPANVALREHVSEPLPNLRLRLGANLEPALRQLRSQDIDIRLNPEGDELLPVSKLASALALRRAGRARSGPGCRRPRCRARRRPARRCRDTDD